jgi:hypothetical protein
MEDKMLLEISGSDLQRAAEQFRERIRSELEHKGKKRFSFPGGSGTGENYEINTLYGLLSIIIYDETRGYIHFINLDQHNNVVASDIEINIPREINRRAGTLLAKDSGHLYICNRGLFTVHMKRLKKSLVIDHFLSNYQNVDQVIVRNKMDSVIRIADINSKSLFADIAQFTQQVKIFKEQFRNV